jgi:hypothetical protein
LNACGNVWLPSSKTGPDILGPAGNISERPPLSFVNSEINISSNAWDSWMILTLLKEEKGGNFQGQLFLFKFSFVFCS